MSNQNSLHFIQKESKDPIHGRVAEILLPCGAIVSIREQNGNDDDILSSFSSSDVDLNSINNFISGIIIKNTFPFAKSEGRLTDKEILKTPLKSKYFILMASRVFSLGNIMTFQWDWQVDGEPPVTYEEDLNQFLWDYLKPFPEPGHMDYFPERITPYPEGASSSPTMEHTLSSGKKIKYNLMNGESENYLMKLPNEKRTVNAGLKARKLQLEVEGEYKEVVNFAPFTASDMKEIRAHVDRYDKQFDGITKIKNPHSGQVIDLPLLTVPDFFYPREI